MDIEHLERLLAELDSSPGNLAHHREELQACAGWCIDRVLALGGADTDETQKVRLTAAQMRTRRLLASINGATAPQE